MPAISVDGRPDDVVGAFVVTFRAIGRVRASERGRAAGRSSVRIMTLRGIVYVSKRDVEMHQFGASDWSKEDSRA